VFQLTTAINWRNAHVSQNNLCTKNVYTSRRELFGMKRFPTLCRKNLNYSTTSLINLQLCHKKLHAPVIFPFIGCYICLDTYIDQISITAPISCLWVRSLIIISVNLMTISVSTNYRTNVLLWVYSPLKIQRQWTVLPI